MKNLFLNRHFDKLIPLNINLFFILDEVVIH
jgi:hypothetical protein